MSHDHLQYDRRMMRHRDTNRMDAKNPDANHQMKDGPKTDVRKRLHRENHLMMVCLMKI